MKKILLLTLFLASCSSNVFRDRAMDYQNVERLEPIAVPKAIKQSNTYNIPVAKGADEPFELLPPEYAEYRD